VFPAAILQPPFFDPAADDAVNYGGIGAVIGHEISHGFDDQGRKSDGDGNLRDWWTAEDARQVRERATGSARSTTSYEAAAGHDVNGKLTMGENIGDLERLAVACAPTISLKGKPAPVIDGFTGDQRFFLGWAQVWRFKYRDEALAAAAALDGRGGELGAGHGAGARLRVGGGERLHRQRVDSKADLPHGHLPYRLRMARPRRAAAPLARACRQATGQVQFGPPGMHEVKQLAPSQV
jgi:hypothetical protein